MIRNINEGNLKVPTGDEIRVYGALNRLTNPTSSDVSAFLKDVDSETVEAICLDRGWSISK